MVFAKPNPSAYKIEGKSTRTKLSANNLDKNQVAETVSRPNEIV
jgi:hypothetical protein